MHGGWKFLPKELLTEPDFSRIKAILDDCYDTQTTATNQLGQLNKLLVHPSQHLWVTFEDGCMWWCTVGDAIEPNPQGESYQRGHFWLKCDRPWSNYSLDKLRLLNETDLPGKVTMVKRTQNTVAKPRAEEAIRRIILGQKDPAALASANARGQYELAVKPMIQRLSWKDFELLINLILDRTGWVRRSSLGGTTEGIDLEVENWATEERAFVQVKSQASQATLDDYVRRFNEREHYARMIFAVHTPVTDDLVAPHQRRPIQIWHDDRLAQLVVHLGLGEWVEAKVA